MTLNFEKFKKSNINFKELDNIRIKNFQEFEIKGFPTKRQEHWKYTDLKTIINNNLSNLEIFDDKNLSKYNKNFLIKNFYHNRIILLNGNFLDSSFIYEDKNKINITSLRKGFSIKENFKKVKTFLNDNQNSMISLNHALAYDGVILEVAENYSFNKPLIIYNFFDESSKNKIINNKVFISLGSKSKLNLVDFYKCDSSIKYFNNVVSNYIVKKDAILKKFTINSGLNNSYNYLSTKVKSYSNSIFENFNLSIGPNFIKNEIHCDLLEPFSSCFVNSVMLLNDHQQHELKTNINHISDKCKSSQIVKSVLLDESNGTFQGKIYVDKNAQKTDGYQLSKTLILSKNSEFNSKPELEIYADDVKCSHGSTIGNIDKNSQFYLMSRGLSKDQANKMIVEGFLNEIIESITDYDVKTLISKEINERINKIQF